MRISVEIHEGTLITSTASGSKWNLEVLVFEDSGGRKNPHSKDEN